MRTLLIVLALVGLVALAGCSELPADDGTESPVETTDAPTETLEETDTPSPTETPTESEESGETETADDTETPEESDELADPSTDVLGWENGRWYNESLPIDESDGLNGTELGMVVNRSMARVEHVRELEFERSVPVEVISREEYRQRFSGSGTPSAAFESFDNAKFEALFLVGEDRDSIAVQNANRGSTVGGFYSPSQDRIVVVSETETPRVSETTLGHELVHALQQQHFGIPPAGTTREEHNARNGLVEGDAGYVDRLYGDRCDEAWNCTTEAEEDGGDGGGADLHLGIYLMEYFPYSDGPGFVAHFRQQGGWEAVDDLYEDPPASTEQVISPEKYGEDEPADVSLSDRSTDEWNRVTPRGRADYASFGQSALLAMFAYPTYDDSRRIGIVDATDFLNYDPDGELNDSDPIHYDIDAVDGWDGDRMWVYENESGEGAYVWRTVWDSPEDAREFADTYRYLLAYWGAEDVDGEPGQYRIPEGENGFADAFALEVDGDTVTIVNAPSAEDLEDVHDGSS